MPSLHKRLHVTCDSGLDVRLLSGTIPVLSASIIKNVTGIFTRVKDCANINLSYLLSLFALSNVWCFLGAALHPQITRWTRIRTRRLPSFSFIFARQLVALKLPPYVHALYRRVEICDKATENLQDTYVSTYKP